MAADLSTTITAISGLVLALATFVSVIVSHQSLKPIATAGRDAAQGAQAELATINGQTVANIVESNEGRRVQADIPRDQRTLAEQHYVDALPEQPPPPVVDG